MSAPERHNVVVELPWRTLLKVLGAAGLVWCVLQLAQTIIVLIVGGLLAVTLDPFVNWLQRRRVPRTLAALLVCLTLLLAVAAFFWMTWASLAAQGQQVLRSSQDAAAWASGRLPDSLREAVAGAAGNAWSAAGRYALQIAASASAAVTVLVLASFLTFYLLLDGRRVRDWLVAFAPQRQRARVNRTLDEGREVIHAYVVGNAITSGIATASTFVVLSVLGVPAALFLALAAGLSDFVPVIGFALSAVPAVILALTVSPQTTLLVVAFYVAYNTVESYVLSPWAYGRRMRLSDVAVILAFVVGTELAGIIGALIALPVAALYPTVERFWLRDELPADTEATHRALERRDAGSGQPQS